MYEYDYPIYNKRGFHSPEDLKESFCRFPLDKQFIDWVAKQGFKIVYDSSWKEGTANVWWSLRQIIMSPHGGDALVNLTLVHELVHIAVPGRFLGEKKYEKIIDEIAEDHIKNLEFMNYIKAKIPVLVQK